MIIFTHHTGEPHGILGAQVAATFFQRKLLIPSIVVGVRRDFSKERLFGFIDKYYEREEKVVAFSHLCGRKDLIGLAQELKQMGFITLLGGPQARQDYYGEPETNSHPHRFRGLRAVMDIGFHGPVDGLNLEHLKRGGTFLEHSWEKNIFLEVDWSNLYTFSDTLKKLDVQLGQVLHAVGCPYSKKTQTVVLPPPVLLRGKGIPEIKVRSEGCIFCDVSRDKGYHGSLEMDRVLAQMEGLPEV
ncbi:MAG: hypothetical protein HXY44_01975, partial [Syntrophaceae bacterium]|nr:hypothetical protein [Syntrophaceae bacterium]